VTGVEVKAEDGERGGEYFVVELSDGRKLAVSRKPEDERAWLGRPDEPASYRGQRGGVGTIDHLLDEWRSEIATSDEARELYEALSALKQRRTT